MGKYYEELQLLHEDLQLTRKHQNVSKKALVIGGSSSIGPIITNEFLRRNYRVLASYNSNPIPNENEDLTNAKLDLRKSSDRKNFIDNLVSNNLNFDVVVTLPSIIFGRQLHDYGDQSIDQIMDINFTSQAKLIRDLQPHISKNGRLILVGSIASERGSFDPLYAASKGALIPFAKSLAKAYGERMTTITVLPGPISDSTMFDEMSPETQAAHLSQSPTGMLLSPLDFAKIISDIAEPHWRHANGSIIRINGGAYV